MPVSRAQSASASLVQLTGAIGSLSLTSRASSESYATFQPIAKGNSTAENYATIAKGSPTSRCSAKDCVTLSSLPSCNSIEPNSDSVPPGFSPGLGRLNGKSGRVSGESHASPLKGEPIPDMPMLHVTLQELELRSVEQRDSATTRVPWIRQMADGPEPPMAAAVPWIQKRGDGPVPIAAATWIQKRGDGPESTKAAAPCIQKRGDGPDPPTAVAPCIRQRGEVELVCKKSTCN